MPAERREAAAVAAGALAVVLAWALVPTYPSYDGYYHLVWGRELLDGVKPTFEAYQAPTQHPLYLLLAAVLGLVGAGADRALVLACELALVVFAWGAFRLARPAFGTWPALAGALLAASSFALLLYAARGYVDVFFLALVFWAGALAQDRRDDRLVLGLLALAGLLRPEGWVLAALFWLWRGRRPALLVLVAAAPLAWMLVDLLVTGDPLWSLHATSELADELDRPRGLDEVPGSFVSFLADTARPPVALLGLAGAVAAWRLLGPRRIAVPLALFGAGAAVFVGTGVLGLAIIPRYLTAPAAVVCLFAGWALLGFTTLAPDHPRRPRWRALAVAGLAGGLVFAAFNLATLDRLRGELAYLGSSHDDLAALLDAVEAHPDGRAALACGPITFPTYRLVPDTRWLLDLPRRRVSTRAVARRAGGVEIVVRGGEKDQRRFAKAAGVSRRTRPPSPGFAEIAANARFAAYGRCP